MARSLLRYGVLGAVGVGAVVLIVALHVRRVAGQIGRGVLDRAEGRESVSDDGPEDGRDVGRERSSSAVASTRSETT